MPTCTAPLSTTMGPPCISVVWEEERTGIWDLRWLKHFQDWQRNSLTWITSASRFSAFVFESTKHVVRNFSCVGVCIVALDIWNVWKINRPWNVWISRTSSPAHGFHQITCTRNTGVLGQYHSQAEMQGEWAGQNHYPEKGKADYCQGDYNQDGALRTPQYQGNQYHSRARTSHSWWHLCYHSESTC